MKKYLMLMVLLLSLFLLSSCEKNDLIDLEGSNMLSQSDEKYYLFFHRDDCEGCEIVMPVVLSYIDITNNDNTYSDKRKIYGVNLSSETNKKLYRLYTGSDGHGKEKDNYINGVTNWEELYIGHTPLLVGVTNGKCSLVAQGSADIENALKKQLEDYN